MRVPFGIDQLCVDTDLVTRPPDTPFEHITHAKLAADLLGVDPLALIGERSIARDHQHTRDARQIGGQILGNPVREILLLRIFAEISKGQDHD